MTAQTPETLEQSAALRNERETIAASAHGISNLLSLAIDLLADLPFSDTTGKRIRGMDQLDALLRMTLAQVADLPDRIEALQ